MVAVGFAANHAAKPAVPVPYETPVEDPEPVPTAVPVPVEEPAPVAFEIPVDVAEDPVVAPDPTVNALLGSVMPSDAKID